MTRGHLTRRTRFTIVRRVAVSRPNSISSPPRRDNRLIAHRDAGGQRQRFPRLLRSSGEREPGRQRGRARYAAAGCEFNSIWPTRGEITTYFGEVDRYSPRGHSGLDIAAPEERPVVAADVGEVLKAYWNDEGYGGLIVIAHPSGYETWYGHLDSLRRQRRPGYSRRAIGLMGSTGFSTGPHLHFEVRQDGQLRDQEPSTPTSTGRGGGAGPRPWPDLEPDVDTLPREPPLSSTVKMSLAPLDAVG